MALQRQTLSIPISEGLDTKTDEKQVPIGKALALENVRFQKTGKLSKRFGFTKKTITTSQNNLNTYSLNAVISDNEYIAVKSNSGIFGYSSSDDKWIKQGLYPGGAKIKTDTIAKNTYDQLNPNQDTSPDGKYTAYCCIQKKGIIKSVLLVLQDNDTGLKKYEYYADNNLIDNPKVICDYYNGNLRVTLWFQTGTSLCYQVYDKDLTVILSLIPTITPVGNCWNVVKDDSFQYLTRQSGTNVNATRYRFDGQSNLGGTITAVTAASNTSMSSIVIGSDIHVSYPISGGLYLVRLSKTTFSLGIKTNKVISPQPNRVALGYNGTQLVLMYDSLTPYVPTGNAFNVGYLLLSLSFYNTDASDIYGRLILASDPYYINGNVNCIVTSPSSAGNNSYYIFDPINNIMAQVFSPTLADTSNSLTTTKVSIIGDRVIMALTRNKGIALNIGELFSTIGLSGVNLRYGCNYKDNSRVKVDQRLYVNDGSLIELDKSAPHENGFIIKAEFKSIEVFTGTTVPDIANKKFSYAIIYEYFDSNGLVTRSAPDYFTTLATTPANTSNIVITLYSPVGSLKYVDSFVKPISGVIYRTTNNGTIYYRIGEVILTNKGFADGIYEDTASDISISDNETLYTTGGVLENNPSPPAEFCFSGGNRIFVGGLEEKDELGFSKKQLFGESVAFSDFFRIRVATGTSSDKTPISAGGYMDGKVIIFRGQSIYFCQGDGPTEIGLGEFSNPEIISSDVGCYEPRSVLNYPDGILFKSKKGIYILGRDLSIFYIGAAVEEFNSKFVIASCLSEKFNEARFYLDSGECLVYNYLFKTWSVFKDQTLKDADSYAGMPILISNNTIFHETENLYKDDGSFYSMKFISPWLKLDLVQGYVRCYQLWIIGDYKSAHTLKCRVYTDYDNSIYEDYSLVYSNTDSPQYQFQISLPKQKVESIKFEIFDSNHAVGSNGEAYDLSNIQVEIGIKAGGFKLAASKSY